MADGFGHLSPLIARLEGIRPLLISISFSSDHMRPPNPPASRLLSCLPNFTSRSKRARRSMLVTDETWQESIVSQVNFPSIQKMTRQTSKLHKWNARSPTQVLPSSKSLPRKLEKLETHQTHWNDQHISKFTAYNSAYLKRQGHGDGVPILIKKTFQ